MLAEDHLQHLADLVDKVDELEGILKAKDAEIYAWRECALYDACMSGPKFKGWDASALNRMRRKYEKKG